ncbi:hypothetical protein ACGC1H_003882 [Rhizoctonia solani]
MRALSPIVINIRGTPFRLANLPPRTIHEVNMSSPNCHLPCASITRLKEASTSLVAAFKEYLDICHNLGASLRREAAKAEDIVDAIDSTLKTVDTVMISQHLGQTCAVLTRIRNQSVSLFFRIPPEVMSQIFENAVFDPRDSETSSPEPFARHVRLIYRRLHNLLRVCSTWNDIITAREVLWTVLPMIEGFPIIVHDIPQLRIQRAGGSKLYLAAAFRWATFDNLKWDFSDVLIGYGPRFYAINVTANEHSIIQDTISMLLSSNRGPPQSLSQLSIQFKKEATHYQPNAPPLHSDCVIPLESHEALFTNMIGRLTALRISGTLFQWDTMVFSSRLVEFRLDHVTLGSDEMLIPFMQALSSASELRDLKIISVNTYCLESPTDIVTQTPVSFPKLQSLHLQDLHFNTLEILLPMITPGSHHVTVYFTEQSLYDNLLTDNNDEGRQEAYRSRVEVSDWHPALGLVPVHTLMMSESPDSGTRWLTSGMLCGLLEALPALKTLKMDLWHFDQVVWADLNRRNHPRLPALENLHLTQAIIHNTSNSRDMLASHPLQQVILGGVKSTHMDGQSSSEPLQEDSDIVQWLRGTVPDFHLIDHTYRSSEFYLGDWQLW